MRSCIIRPRCLLEYLIVKINWRLIVGILISLVAFWLIVKDVDPAQMVAAMVARILNLKTLKGDDNAADALAVGIATANLIRAKY